MDDLQQNQTKDLIGFSDDFRSKIFELKTYLFDNFYTNFDIYRENKRGKLIISDLFNLFVSDLKLIPKEFYIHQPRDSEFRVVCDYIAGMTDSYALKEHQRFYLN